MVRACATDGSCRCRSLWVAGAHDRASSGEVEVRDVVELPVTIDHNVVDGAPAARFGAELRDLIEHATALCELP